MSNKLWHVRIDNRGNIPVNGHFNEASLKKQFKNAWWLSAALEMDVNDHLNFFRSNTEKDRLHVKRIS